MRPTWRDELQKRLPECPDGAALFGMVRNLRLALFVLTGRMPGKEPLNTSTRQKFLDRHYDDLRGALQQHMADRLKYEHAHRLCCALSDDGVVFLNALHRVATLVARLA